MSTGSSVSRVDEGGICYMAGVELTARGAVVTDGHLRTSADNIWAAGDVCGKLQFTYISLDDSRIVLDDMLGRSGRTTENRGAFSYSVFMNPPFSWVGMSESEAKVLRETDGMLKAIDYGIKASSIRDFIFTHPTMSESINGLFDL